MSEEELKVLRKSIHDLNNRVGVILATAELMQIDHSGERTIERSKLIEGKALEAREILRDLSDHYFE
jgi:hypothetical protein